MSATYLQPTQEAGRKLFSQNIAGPVVMLNLLRFRDIADYTNHPALAPGQPLSGKEAFDLYIEATKPFLAASGGEILFLGDAGEFFIGPEAERWDLVMLIRQRSLADFLAFASNEEYGKVLGHREAAVIDSRLLPAVER